MKTQVILLLSVASYALFLAVYYYSVNTLGDLYATNSESGESRSRANWGPAIGMGWMPRLAPVRVVRGRG